VVRSGRVFFFPLSNQARPSGYMCNFFILAILIFFTNRPLKKLIPYLDPDKGASLDGAICPLQGATMTGALAWTRRPGDDAGGL
jgi:hypothetical protein